MMIFVGLGNPGPRYERNRHNIGFMAIDAIHQRQGFEPWRDRFQAQVSEGRLGNKKCLLMKPMTFMNESGRSVQAAVQFYKLQPDQIYVFHDELDLPPGKLRTKSGGGAAGNNGLRSIIAHIGPHFGRIRIGIGHPGNKNAVQHYVLHDFAKADDDWIEPMKQAIAEHIALLAKGEESTFMNKIHLALNPPDEENDNASDSPEKD
ncbi:MAG: aminoacyl-tRNA hydrolase [Fimbriimonadaceae bacterium]|nr:aminoacyl-tRNA hydrolase [Alphaproteobacteria bacterium]